MSEAGIVASFDRNDIIIDWANKQPLAKPVTCLADGHDGVWNPLHMCLKRRRPLEIHNGRDLL